MVKSDRPEGGLEHPCSLLPLRSENCTVFFRFAVIFIRLGMALAISCHMVYGGVMRESYDYDNIDDAPLAHRRAAEYAFVGMPNDTIAALIGVKPRTVATILSHPPIVAFIERMRADVALCDAEMTRIMQTEGPHSAIQLAQELLRAASDMSNDLKYSDRLKVCEFMLNHDPTGRFSKRTKHETSARLDIFDHRELEQLEAQGALLGLPQPGDSDGKHYVDGDFEIIGQEPEPNGGDGDDAVSGGNACTDDGAETAA